MDKPLAVVVSDETILPEICGANDSNLKVLEELLGVPGFFPRQRDSPRHVG